MKPSELVAQARDELFKGWAKGTLMNGEGSVCAVGALRRATMANVQNGAVGVFKEARQALNAKAVEMAADVGIDSSYWSAPLTQVETFNDYRGTQKQDMLNLFDKTVIGLEETGR